MAKGETPGTNVGTDGGIYQEQGRRGGRKENFANVKDHGRLPPTTEPGNTWVQVKRTPDSHR
jgi:hypothetical protein